MPRQIVLQIVQHLRPGGIETMVLDLLDRSSPDIEVHILALEGAKNETILSWPRLASYEGRIHFLGKKPKLDLGALYRLVRMLRKMNVKVVHSHHIGPLLYGGVAARLAGIRTVVHTEHDAWHLKDRKRRKLQSTIAKIVCPTFVADADLVAAALKEFIPDTKPMVIHNGVDTQKFSPGNQHDARRALDLPENISLIGCAARLETVKGHHLLLEAMTHLPTSVHLALAGDGSLRPTLTNEVLSKGLQERVHFLGTIDNMVDFHKALDVFCLASEQEGLPLSPLEAQASGVPVVLPNVGGCIEAICPETGWLVSERTPLKMAEGLRMVLDNIGNNNPRTFVTNHRNLLQTVASYEAVYNLSA
jgi:glycosyltransferase involved in cell wall biosynthesis